VLFCGCSLLAGVDASAAQKQPVTKTCLQCGAILPSGISVCRFCDSNFQPKIAAPEGASVLPVYEPGPAAHDYSDYLDHDPVWPSAETVGEEQTLQSVPAWRGELADRVEAYRVRRKRIPPNDAQSRLPFAEPTRISLSKPAARNIEPGSHSTSLATLEASPYDDGHNGTVQQASPETFSFTIAIGRIATEPPLDPRMMIDVSLPADSDQQSTDLPADAVQQTGGLYPVASMWDRRLAGIVDGIFLLFAYGGFLALFGSLGGQFSLTKLSAAVCVSALAIVYLQYFALFTIFGGTTPGMMCRGLQVVNFSGDEPSARQLVLRSIGYVMSAGTGFLGFIWALWDEDALTWHDRISRTYLSSAQMYADVESHGAAHPHT
jgi:uncharacterized RDD family membrane protein YckC/ribosomal protein L40E